MLRSTAGYVRSKGFAITVLCSVVVIFIYCLTTNSTSEISDKQPHSIEYDTQKTTPTNDSNFPSVNLNLKYISSDYLGCSGLGNLMFRQASLYGLGKLLKRRPYSGNRRNCGIRIDKIEKYFPAMRGQITYVEKVDSKLEKVISFGWIDQHYDDPRNIHPTNATFLHLGAGVLQSYKYFHHLRSDVLRLFKFSDELKSMATDYASKLNLSTDSLKLCMHFRRTDFKNHRYMQTEAAFVNPVLKFLTGYFNQTLDLLFFTDDKPFAKDIAHSAGDPMFDRIHVMNMTNEGAEMYFAAQYCDAFVITASGSTYAWWIAYLMDQDKPIFYNGQVSRNRDKSADVYDYDWFLPNWNRLELTNGTTPTGDMTIMAYIDQRWNFERMPNYESRLRQ